jgi:hypothetical protein
METYIENWIIIGGVITLCWFIFYASYKGKIKPFMKTRLSKIIDEQTPRYYNLQGKQIPKPSKTTITQPIYDLQADTTATIQIKPIQKEETKKVDEPISHIVEEKKQQHTIYCMKCKEKRQMKDVTINKMETSKGIKFFAKGTCTVCNNTKCNGFIKG